MKRAALYVRVSTDEQKKHGLSVDNQIEALKEYCNGHNYTIAGLYNDAGISARKSYKKRPALLQLINDCQNNKIDIILFTKLDRWFRNVGDYYEVQRILDECNVPWKTIWEQYETETSNGILMMNIKLTISQNEADLTRERINRTFEYKRAKGEHLGTPPFGYKRIDGHLYKDEKTRELVEMAFDVFFKTKSTTQVLVEMEKLGYSWSRHRVQRLCYGQYAGNVNGHICEPYITQEQYEEAQKIRASHVKSTNGANKTYLFSGLCHCGVCNGVMRSNFHICNGIYYLSYGCCGRDLVIKHDRGIYLSEIKIERHLLANLDELIHINNINADLKEYKKALVQNEKQKKKLEAKLNRIGIRFEEGDISIEEYRQKKRDIQNEISLLVVEPPTSTVKLPRNWRTIYKSLDKVHKQQFWHSIIKSITIDQEKNITVTFL